MIKNFRVSEVKDIQFRAEFFNILNHPNFRLPDSDRFTSNPRRPACHGGLRERS